MLNISGNAAALPKGEQSSRLSVLTEAGALSYLISSVRFEISNPDGESEGAPAKWASRVHVKGTVGFHKLFVPREAGAVLQRDMEFGAVLNRAAEERNVLRFAEFRRA